MKSRKKKSKQVQCVPFYPRLEFFKCQFSKKPLPYFHVFLSEVILNMKGCHNLTASCLEQLEPPHLEWESQGEKETKKVGSVETRCMCAYQLKILNADDTFTFSWKQFLVSLVVNSLCLHCFHIQAIGVSTYMFAIMTMIVNT